MLLWLWLVENCCQACHCSGSNSSTRGARLARSRALGGAIAPEQVDGKGGNGRHYGNVGNYGNDGNCGNDGNYGNDGNDGNDADDKGWEMLARRRATGAISLLADEDDCNKWYRGQLGELMARMIIDEKVPNIEYKLIQNTN